MLKSFSKYIIGVASLSSCVLAGGCDSWVYDTETRDCSPHYQVRLTFDRNMSFADAMDAEVDEVSLYVVDKSGTIVWQKDVVSKGISPCKLELEVDPGVYDVYAWCKGRSMTEGEVGGSTLAKATPSFLSDLQCTLDHKDLPDGRAVCDTDLHRLYHGRLLDVELPDHYGTYEFTLPLTKDTNVVRVMLQQMNGDGLDPSQFHFSIEDDNLKLDIDNCPVAGHPVVYQEWTKSFATTSTEGRSDVINTIVAEMTTGRLMEDHDARLKVTQADGTTVLEIPLVEYMLMVKGKYHEAMGSQEYLDRKDEYNLTFFLDSKCHWINTVVVIEAWRIVINEMDK